MKFLKRLGALVALVVCSAFILTACSNEYGKYRYSVDLTEYLDGRVSESVAAQVRQTLGSKSLVYTITLRKNGSKNEAYFYGDVYSALPMDEELENELSKVFRISLSGTYKKDGDKLIMTDENTSATYEATIKDGVISIEIFEGEIFELKLEK